MKPNDCPVYVHRGSNHPKGILENIPKSVNRRLSKILSNEEIFNIAAPPYQEALQKSGYSFKLKFEPPVEKTRNNRNRKRNETYFNPPYSLHVKTNVGKLFLNAIDKCFPAGHVLKQVMNRNNIKIKYKCMPNLKKEISRHNSKILKPKPTTSEAECNCLQSSECPMPGKCLTNRLVYKLL